MKPIHNQEKEQFITLFQQENIDRFEDRFKVLEAFLNTEQHFTVQELQRLLTSLGNRFDTQFVEDTLERMCQFGFARKNQFDNGVTRYEHRHLGQHHDHMVCTKCGGIVEFQDGPLEHRQVQVALSHGFHMLQHRMEIYGICADCLHSPIVDLTLASAKPGDLLTVRGLTGGAGARIRLMSMGLRVGDGIEVISNLNQGQVVVAVDAKRYVLGKGIAEKIQVRRRTALEETSETPPSTGVSLAMSHMRQGQQGTIARVGGNGAVRRRLLEMGLIKGTQIYVEKYAPLKDPMEINIKGCHVSLRVDEASEIMVNDVS